MDKTVGLFDDGRCACPECGALLEELSVYIQRLDALRVSAAEDAQAARAEYKKLRADQHAALKDSPFYEDAKAVLEYWQERCQPKAKDVVGGERLKLVIARLRGGFDLRDLKQCVDGFAQFPYVVDGQRKDTGSKRKWYAKATLIFRDGEHVEQGMMLAEEAEGSRRIFRPPEATPTLGDIGQAALRYVEFGFAVFPCLPGEKRPATRNGLLNATHDRRLVLSHWTSHPDHNVAIRTGEESGLIVLDQDANGFESLADLEREHEPLPRTQSVVTPSGGEHYYFRHPGKRIINTTGWPGPGLDIRGDGGYVLAPPSMVAGRLYEPDETDAPIADTPEWLVTSLIRHQTNELKDLFRKRKWLGLVQRGVKEGERNSQLTSLAGRMAASHVDPVMMLELTHMVNRAQCRPPLPDRDVDRIVQSCLKMQARRQ
jgi:hypothetical protein